MMLRRIIASPIGKLTALYLAAWLILWLDSLLYFRINDWIRFVGFLFAVPLIRIWLLCFPKSPLIRRAIMSVAIFPAWLLLAQLALLFSAYGAIEAIHSTGKAVVFFIGLAWATWAVDLQTRRTPPSQQARSWNPFQLVAWYFGKKSRKLRQSLLTLVVYALLFGSITFMINQMTGCSVYESPVGGGEEKRLKQVVKVQKVVRKNYVINPYSSIIFNPPPIDQVKLQLLEVTKHLYEVGQGEGEGAGFSEGTKRGKVRFIRLKYAGGDWQQDMERGSDLNLLTEYGVRTGHEVSDRPEPMEIKRLKSFPNRKSPPMVYMTGQRQIRVSDAEVKILRSYLLEKHGMLFADNGGSRSWEVQFVEMMRRVLPTIEPISVYLDHPIHRTPYVLPKLPYVVKHGRSDAIGWVVDGRLVVYYHPGDIGDAWADGHSGVPREVWESCYQLGVNVIFYAHAQYNRWLESTK
jgi:hypothetical protein